MIIELIVNSAGVTDPSSVYPNTFFLPPSGVQRGTTFIGGDPLSPTWTSVPGAYRLELNETTDLPSIPAQPIGYGDASRLVSSMGGEEVQVQVQQIAI